MDTAEEWINEVLTRKPPNEDDARAIWEKTLEERDLGLMEGPFEREHFDALFGKENEGAGYTRCGYLATRHME